ncbi:MAG: Tyrosine-tRNA ligase [Candidatus Nomurabacteria bacterium GW2011_GWE1_32_28]|uniref:Tyrosine--tRNA ligase n=1 Tax=Candidatus Nomurabacteria bacterium GW2011_GWF1_31_48 TaxID=1618767 RepID=A0A0F9YG11_9BACT|nr:MAG: Tyrosine-tRNA ligase [Candidatus Nomurabacteria bacterium GW2011_GWF2_30_133]KKP28785.1 MAG: Tyrosine-tRNA ligase [Candidatus Nomurabacteria bacterium GW2011_GWE2_31_40]KKP30363.1 MAG: Tyrosine-tRNA ligase [Candidatus Nomurabacteria bacterium GW2011_GWF1_31_48]KKP34890.1 MAG: Tyrosine-tRNA ligase [Candidatus Nomurabacteria bacterium GW2011_GWE1_32_28]HAS80980.1 tyrosine--tRNA ligase [Candidatus Nomurabacteria bacterium]
MGKTLNKEKIDELFSRGVGEFIDPNGIFRKKLETSPEKIVIKFGVDPNRPDIHLGHAVVLHRLRQFQDLGCRVVFLVGDITAMIGDPTGKSKIRPEIEHIEIQKNMKTYLDQVDKILLKDPKVFSWTMNSDWLVSINDIIAPDNQIININIGNKTVATTPVLPGNHILAKAHHWEATRMQKNNINSYTLISVLAILRKITFNRLIERDMFQDRIKEGLPVFMHEMMYPVIQGIDSNAISNIYGSCDLEVGGTDQLFNMLVGRDVMDMNKKIPQSVLSFRLLEGTDGKEKMSKSLDNYIGITDEPNDMYGKVMSISDSSIGNYFELCTFTSTDEVEEIKKKLEKASVNPKDLKMDLARQIVAIYHGEDKAKKAEESFVNVFQKREVPEEMIELKKNSKETLMDILVRANILSSKSDFRRLVEEGAITDLDTNKKIEDVNLVPENKMKFKIGKKKFIKIK